MRWNGVKTLKIPPAMHCSSSRCVFIFLSGPPPVLSTARLSHTGPSWADRVKCNQSVAKSSQPLASPVDKLGKKSPPAVRAQYIYNLASLTDIVPLYLLQVKKTLRAGRPCREDALPNRALPQQQPRCLLSWLTSPQSRRMPSAASLIHHLRRSGNLALRVPHTRTKPQQTLSSQSLQNLTLWRSLDVRRTGT